MWIIRGKSTKILFSLIFSIILCSFPLFTIADIRTFSHKEKIDDYGPTAIPLVWDSKVFDNGTMVIRIVRKDPNAIPQPNKICFINMFSLRIINLDGTVIEKDYNLDIPTFNYCAFQNGTLIEDLMKYDLIRKDQILITYYKATKSNDFDTYKEWGIVIDLDGNVLSRTEFGPAFIDGVSQRILPEKSKIQFNINREKGFLRYNWKKITDDEIIEWQQYRIEPDGSFTSLTVGNIASNIFTAVSMSTADEGYAIVFANSINYFNTTNPFLPQGQLFILPIGYNQLSVSPFLLYQTVVPNLTISGLICNIAYVAVGKVCFLIARQNDPTGILPDKDFNIKIDFLSSSSVTSFQDINEFLPSHMGLDWTPHSLTFGGYLLTNTSFGTNSFMYGYLFDEYNKKLINWEFPEPVPTNLMGIFEILPHNNTLLIAQKEIVNSWQFKVIDLPKFAGNRDNGYSNLNVESTIPTIKSTVNPNLDRMSIKFYDPVALSTGKLSIYQKDGDKTYLRQSFQPYFLSIENDGRTLTGKILDSTFSVSNGNYYIKMDNDVVKDKVTSEPMLGIRENIWIFTTEERIDQLSPSTTGLLRLTPEGTQYFDNLTSDQQSFFFNNLLNDLSYAVPITRSRLNSNGRTQMDNSIKEKQYLISIDIKETRIENDISAETVIKYLDTMVTHKDQTPIGEGQTTQHLDEKYGFVRSPNLLEKYKFELLGVFLFVGLLMGLFFFAQRRDSNGNNIAILQLGMIIFDLVMDILFVSSNAIDIPILYFPSVFFLVMPVGINTILAISIVSKEIANTKFNQWFRANEKVAFLFTILAGADIKALNILYSKLAGFSSLKAPFSESLKEKILWGSCLSIFTEDIPQVAIQIYYMRKFYFHDIIPFLTLISSTLNLTINIISRLYNVTNRVINRNASNYIHDSDDSDDSNDSNDLDDLDDLDAVILLNSKKKIKRK